MTLKQTLENHIVVIVLSTAVAAFGVGWGACELVRVAYKTEKISDLEKNIVDLEKKIADQSQQIKNGVVAVEPYQKKIAESLSNSQRLEAELSALQNSLARWQLSFQSLKAVNSKLQNDIQLSSANCSAISMVRAIEEKKENVERNLDAEITWHTESTKVDDYKRRIAEYQTRLLSLQEKLVCSPQLLR